MKRRAALIGILILICIWRMHLHDTEKPAMHLTGATFILKKKPTYNPSETAKEFCHVVDDDSRLLAVPCDETVAPEDEVH